MSKMVFRKVLGHLVPVDEPALALMKKAKPGELLIVEARRPRNILHHRKLFALLNLVVDNTDRYPDVETLLFALKIATGHCEIFPGADGKREFIKPKSISFESLSQDEFEPLYDRFVNVIVSQIIPGTGKQALLDEVEAMLEPRAA
jgi:hypothetical protein